MKDWDEIRAWRRSKRAELLSRRLAVPRSEKYRVRSVLTDLVLERVPKHCTARVGFYWPFKGEIDFRHLVRELVAGGAEAALPVVVEKARPLEFWAWHPRMKMQRGIWNIPVPADRHVVRPTALLVPLLGFDGAGYRLGYGGGYYDRTLAAMTPRPLTIGVGYEIGRLQTIHPQPHDIPMDAIVTEKEFVWFNDPRRPRDDADRSIEEVLDDSSCFASPPCFMHELDPSYLGYMNQAELLALLTQLLEAERAGARNVDMMSEQATAAESRAALRDVARDEARFCAMLTRHIARLGGKPGPATGAFYDRLIALEAPDQRLDLLNRGQGWVIAKIREALRRIGDSALHRDLTEMLDVHERNIERCTQLG